MKNKKILVVESDDHLREVIRFYLEGHGYTVIEKNSPEGIIDFAKAHQPHLMIISIRLFTNDGSEVIQSLKKAEETRNIPVLIVSVATQDQRLQNISEGFLTKPFDKDSLLGSIDKILGEKPGKQRNQKILVVDDEPDVVDIITTHLEEKGHISLKAYDGQEAVEKASREQPDLIILDIQMPKLNGFEVMNVLSQDQTTWSIPIIVLSGTNIPDLDKEKGKKMGVAKFLTKPFESNALLKEIEAVLCEKKKS